MASGYVFKVGDKVRFLGFVPDADPEPERYNWHLEPGDVGVVDRLVTLRGDLHGYGVVFNRSPKDFYVGDRLVAEMVTAVAEDEIVLEPKL